MNSSSSNVVLVHGAWADGSCWSAVIERLQARGYNVTAPQFPESSLADDVAYHSHDLDDGLRAGLFGPEEFGPAVGPFPLRPMFLTPGPTNPSQVESISCW